ncbi:hypothetical protein ABE488_05080 [Luteimonas sp. TWI662]|uniref:hypothetical protein n=1 Tax=Luteimonas sp. TWI662 TaxID=3136789 RepID=UPI00320A94B8
MLDPTRLVAGAKAVYGEADFARDRERAVAHGIADAPARVREVLGGDIALNAQGLCAWLDRMAR